MRRKYAGLAVVCRAATARQYFRSGRSTGLSRRFDIRPSCLIVAYVATLLVALGAIAIFREGPRVMRHVL